MRTAELLTDIEREIIEEVCHVCQRNGWPLDLWPALPDYLARGGRFDANQIIRAGGWKRLCARAGMRHAVAPEEPVLRKVVDPEAAELARRLDAGMAFIRDHFREGIGLSDVARAAHYSPFHFHRLFQRHFGRTPKQIITELQVAEAQRLMAAGTPLKKIAPLAGFAHQSHFTSRFKQVTLTTPARWVHGHRGQPALPPPQQTMPQAA